MSGLNINTGVGMSGHFQLIAQGGQRGRVVLAEFDNMILDAGRNRLASGVGPTVTHCHVGTGSTAVAASQTALANKVAATNTIQSLFGVATYVAGPPPYCTISQTWRFATGAAAGNLTEVGVGWDATNLFSRALIVDGGGSPTTVTVLGDEVLDVVYTIRAYPMTADATGSVTLNGVSYSYTMREALMPWTDFRTLLNSAPFSNNPNNIYVFGGSIAAITGSPSGASSIDYVANNTAAYVNNSYQRTNELSFDLNQGNIAGGIKSIQFSPGYGTWAYYQIEFTPNIPKDATKRLKLSFTHSFALGPVP